MSSNAIIHVEKLSKCYHLYNRPQDRLKQFLWRGKRTYYREFWALRDVSFEVMPGEVIGIIGNNGAGKSTLLQLICGTLTPTSGKISIQGRIAALLELGAGFNPEFSGRENVFMSAAIMGLSSEEIANRFEDIVSFSGIREFIDQPVKTYSSGMYVRLAFSIAISVDPDILVIDEALSVGDGEFSRRSFERIMALKNAGKTILFCTHALYQLEALCNKAIWIKDGKLMLLSDTQTVTSAYQLFLSQMSTLKDEQDDLSNLTDYTKTDTPMVRFVNLGGNGMQDENGIWTYISGVSSLDIEVQLSSCLALPPPTLALVITHNSSVQVCSFSSLIDACPLVCGQSEVRLTLPLIPLLKGHYSLDVFLLCEQGIHVYEHVRNAAEFNVRQSHLEVGVVHIPRLWGHNKVVSNGHT